jgi:hypothetical protein
MQWTPQQTARVAEMRAAGASYDSIATEFGCTAASVRGAVYRSGVTSGAPLFTKQQGCESNVSVVPNGSHNARIRRTTERILIIPDVHVPFEDVRAWDLMLSVARAIRPETIVVLGDFADMWSVSSHDKDPRRKDNLESEMKSVAMRLDEIDSLGAARKVFCEGNHEERLTRYMTQRAPDVFEYVQFRKIQRLDERGWTWVPYREHHKIGKMFFTHDLGEAGAYAHARARGTMGGNVVIGHVHRMGVTYASTAEGTGHVSAAFGWLGDASEAKYLPAAKRAAWQLGFGIGYM